MNFKIKLTLNTSFKFYFCSNEILNYYLQINCTVHADIHARIICVLSLLSTDEIHAKPGNQISFKKIGKAI